MKKVLGIVFVIVLFSSGLFSYEYIVNRNGTGTPAPGNVRITTLTGGNWDNGYYDMTLPASNQFYFYGKLVTHVRIWTNGYITFGFGSAPTDYSDPSNDSIPAADNPNGYIAPWWDDWNLVYGGEIWYALGAAYLNVEWRGVAHNIDTTASYDFRVLIGSNTNPAYPNQFKFHYTDVDSGTGIHDRGVSGTIGIEHYTGYQGEKFSVNEQEISNGMIIRFIPYVPIYDMTDGFADGDPDPVVFRVDDGQGYFFYKDNGSTYTNTHAWGTRNDVPLTGDYDGNGAIDYAVFRPSNSVWFIQYLGAYQWGQDGDIPVPADYDGDGDTDLAVFRPSSGLWFIYYLPGGETASVQWGQIGDVPVPADYDNDGKADLAVYRPSNNVWYIQKSSNPAQTYAFAWGTDGDVPMPANFQSSSYSTACVYRPSTGMWYSYNQQTGAPLAGGPYGMDSDHPVPNDWNGGGISDMCVFRPADGMWYSAYGEAFSWGMRGDKPRCRRSMTIVAPSVAAAPGVTDETGRPLSRN